MSTPNAFQRQQSKTWTVERYMTPMMRNSMTQIQAQNSKKRKSSMLSKENSFELQNGMQNIEGEEGQMQ